MAKLKVLFFITESKPTSYDRQRALRIANAAVCYRSLANVKVEDEAEQCDMVAGDAIPAQYSDVPQWGAE